LLLLVVVEEETLRLLKVAVVEVVPEDCTQLMPIFQHL
jgi:hypothetical protein